MMPVDGGSNLVDNFEAALGREIECDGLDAVGYGRGGGAGAVDSRSEVFFGVHAFFEERVKGLPICVAGDC